MYYIIGIKARGKITGEIYSTSHDLQKARAMKKEAEETTGVYHGIFKRVD